MSEKDVQGSEEGNGRWWMGGKSKKPLVPALIPCRSLPAPSYGTSPLVPVSQKRWKEGWEDEPLSRAEFDDPRGPRCCNPVLPMPLSKYRFSRQSPA